MKEQHKANILFARRNKEGFSHTETARQNKSANNVYYTLHPLAFLDTIENKNTGNVWRPQSWLYSDKNILIPTPMPASIKEINIILTSSYFPSVLTDYFAIPGVLSGTLAQIIKRENPCALAFHYYDEYEEGGPPIPRELELEHHFQLEHLDGLLYADQAKELLECDELGTLLKLENKERVKQRFPNFEWRGKKST